MSQALIWTHSHVSSFLTITAALGNRHHFIHATDGEIRAPVI